MKNCKVVGQIYETMDYDQFKFMKLNRVRYGKHTNELVEFLNAGKTFPPILVNKKMEIMDGQHRYDALVIAGKPIRFIVVENMSIEDIIQMNLHSRKWFSIDFIRSAASKGLEGYDSLLKFIEYTGFSVELAKLVIRIDNSSRSKSFNIGLLNDRLMKVDYVKACMYASFFKDIKKIYKNTKSSSYILRACLDIFERKSYRHARMIAQLERYQDLCKPQATPDDYRKFLIQIYNEGANSLADGQL